MNDAVKIMGVVNVTPDSFSDGGAFAAPDRAVAHALQLHADGAAIVDIGGESTRPGADFVEAETELRRVVPVIEELSRRSPVEISIDTRKPEVAAAAVAAGASIWNDVSALTFSPDSLAVASRLRCRVVLMHARGEPRTMQDAPVYDDVVDEVLAYLAGRIGACVSAGIDEQRLIVDPGIGFGKTLAHNLQLLAGLERFCALGAPVLLGVSRKRSSRPSTATGRRTSALAGRQAALAGVRRGQRSFGCMTSARPARRWKIDAAIGDAPQQAGLPG
ncbi:MAG: dihydropteroate synthase [Parvularculaceae bacterium]